MMWLWQKFFELLPEPMRNLLRFLAFVRRRFDQDGALSVAASLSYTSLLAIVPLLAIGLAMLAAFPVFNDVRDQLQSFIFKNFVPHVGEAVEAQVTRFVSNAGRATAAGIVGLAVTAIMLLVTIETAMNRIFRVERERSMLSRLLVYWTALTLGPLLIGASFSLSGYLMAAGRWVKVSGYGHAMQIVSRPLPNLLIILAFSLMYLALPNRPIRWRDALVGGVVAGLLFALLRFSFGVYVGNVRMYESVYGAISAIPIFLVWMYMSWAAIMVGGEVTAALPEWRAQVQDGPGPLPSRRRLALALELLYLLHRAAQEGGKGVSRKVMLDHTAAAEQSLSAVLARLCEAGFATPSSGGRYVLCRDLENARLYDLVRALDLALEPQHSTGCDTPWHNRLEERVLAANRAEHAALDITLKELFSGEKLRETAAQ